MIYKQTLYKELIYKAPWTAYTPSAAYFTTATRVTEFGTTSAVVGSG